MKKLKQKINSIKSVYRKRPKLIIPTVAVFAIVLFGMFECFRAWRYQNQVEEYKNSVKVQNIHQTVTQLNESVEKQPAAAYCNITIDGLLSNFNEAYEPTVEEAMRPENLQASLLEQVEEASPAPAFSSLAEFLPKPKHARNESEQLSKALIELEKLSKVDARSEYCLELSNVLARTYFLSDLKKPEGVGALFVGQVENFQTNVAQAQEMMKTLKYPTDFEAEHIQIYEFLNKVAVDLRKDENKYTAFARNIEQDLVQLETTLSAIREKTADLQKIPQQITLQAGYLE